MDAHTYHFVSREEFELDVLHERFLEHQEIKGQLYGTSVLAVKKIVESGRVPVLGLQPQVSRTFRKGLAVHSPVCLHVALLTL